MTIRKTSVASSCGQLALLTGVLLAVQPRVAIAEGALCYREDFERLYQAYDLSEPKEAAKAFDARLAKCRGKLTVEEELYALDRLIRFFREEPIDLANCRRVVERQIQLDKNEIELGRHWWVYGNCGGDCTASPHQPDCLAGARKRDVELATKMGPEMELEQAVPCKFSKARELIAKMDRASFHDQGLRLIRKYRMICDAAKLPEVQTALASDEALLQFHKGDDAACLRALDSGPRKPSPEAEKSQAAAYNRALCGGACSLNETACASAARVRETALEERFIRLKLREVTSQQCWRCKPGQKCDPWPNDTIVRVTGKSQPDSECNAMSWDLTGRRTCHLARHCPLSDYKSEDELRRYEACLHEERKELSTVDWAGDLNGDGLGDYVSMFKVTQSDEYWSKGIHPYLVMVAWIGCGEHGVSIAATGFNTQDLPKPIRYRLKVTEQAGSTIKKACAYPCTDAKCKTVNQDAKPARCLDLSVWENAVKAGVESLRKPRRRSRQRPSRSSLPRSRRG